jgi:hypothetical protein
MKKIIAVIVLTAVLFEWSANQSRIAAADSIVFQTYEFVTIHWGGRDNTQLIRSNGKIEVLGSVLKAAPRPDGVDERSFYMNIAMNAVAKEGYDFAGMTSDVIVMKRLVSR